METCTVDKKDIKVLKRLAMTAFSLFHKVMHVLDHKTINEVALLIQPDSIVLVDKTRIYFEIIINHRIENNE